MNDNTPNDLPKRHPVKCMLSYGERILGSFEINEEISEHLKSGGTARITIGGHDRTQNWSGHLARIEVIKIED